LREGKRVRPKKRGGSFKFPPESMPGRVALPTALHEDFPIIPTFIVPAEALTRNTIMRREWLNSSIILTRMDLVCIEDEKSR
jgi:hypothetical protein